MANLHNQKILDIIPPGEKKEPFFVRKEKRQKEFRSQKPKRRGLRLFFLVFTFLLISAAILSYFIFQKAEIIVWPKTQELSFREKVGVDIKTVIVDISSNVIPGKVVEDIQKVSVEYPATGKTQKSTKAEGVIRVYNAYSTAPQTLVAKTRFVSAEGKLFRSLETVTVPGGQYEKGKLVPGFIDVKAQADKAGQDYNIGPSTFSIPGFAGTPRYTSFYGKSLESMEGGSSGEATEVTKEDLDKAEISLKEKLSETVMASLRGQDAAGIVIIDEASRKDFKNIVFSAKVGAIVDNFKGEGEIYSKVLTFRKSDIEEFVEEYILVRLPEDQDLDQKSLKINYSPESIIIEAGRMVLSLDFSIKTYFKISDEEIKKGISGKSLAGAKDFLDKDPRFAEAEIKTWPFWVKNIPQKFDKIRIEQRVD